MTENCVFCGRPMESVHEMNNPAPLRDTGHCCHDCDARYVIASRILIMLGHPEEDVVKEMNDEAETDRKEGRI